MADNQAIESSGTGVPHSLQPVEIPSAAPAPTAPVPTTQSKITIRRRWPLGLQGRLTLAFMLLLMVGLEADAILYAHQTHNRLIELLGQQARQVAWGLDFASQEPLANHDAAPLRRLGEDLLRTHNVLFVVFYDTKFEPVAFAHRDPDFKPGPLLGKMASPSALFVPEPGSSPVLGNYVQLLMPIIQQPAGKGAQKGPARPVMVGYVHLAVSQTPELAQLSRVNILAGLIAAGVALGALPLVLLIVHRIFRPIRQLVAATNQIANGSYDTQVMVDRSDAIGTLARAFNEMAKTVKLQRDALAAANRKLDRDLDKALTDLRDKNAQLEELAATDPLTGLYNRRHFGRVLDQLFSEASRYGDDLACVMIDLDGYKPLNDAYGHAVGDELLMIVGRVIAANMRRMDIAARYGGDEFVLLLPRAGSADAAVVAERIRDEYRQASARFLKREQGVTMSVGIASLLHSRPARPDQLVIQADAALYQAKEAGRDRVTAA